MAQDAKWRGCLVCGDSTEGVDPRFAFCGGCYVRWQKSAERARWLNYANGSGGVNYRANIAIGDFVRRMQAERAVDRERGVR